MVDQLAIGQHPIAEAVATLQQVMGGVPLPQAAVNEQRLQTR